MIDELIEYDAIGLGNLIRKGEITPLELLEITIERIERVNPRLNAVVHKLYDQARIEAGQWADRIKSKKANGAIFAGVPFLLKNLLAEYEGTPFDEGSRAIKGYVSKLDTRTGQTPAGRGADYPRQDEHPGVRAPAHHRADPLWANTQPLESRFDSGRFQRWFSRGRGGRDRTHGPRKRWRGIHPDPGFLLRALWSEAHQRTESLGTPLR